MTNPRITLRMIAKEAGRDLATVSMALRNDPRLLPETIEHIKSVARRMGYVPDLEVSSVMSRLRTRGRTNSGEVFAYLHARPLHEGHEEEGSEDGSDPYYRGCHREAQLQGYKLDTFSLADPAMTPRRLSQVLRTRAIRGVLIGPFPRGQTNFDMEWARFSAVALGASLHRPAINRVSNGQYSSMRIAMEHLIARDYKRIGFAIDRVHNARLQNAFLGAYLACQNDLPESSCLKPLLVDDNDTGVIRAWLKQEKPDVIVSSLVYSLYKKGELTEKDFPPKISFVGTDVCKDGELSGIFQNHEHDGVEGVRMLIGQLLRNDFGIPATPIVYTTWGTWYEGKTTLLG